MITKQDIYKLLDLLNYSSIDKKIYFKQFGNEIIKVDIHNEKIFYPDYLKVNDLTTSNFSHPENFVVFECVNRLLSKGYLSKNIELEPKWQLGRGSSGGKADILIKDNNGDEYLIIECKTYGGEYEKSWSKTKNDGDQLFSYAQQVKKTQFLCLYTSDIINGQISYLNKIITLNDNEEYLKTFKSSKVKSFKEASDVKELFYVWKSVYDQEYDESGIFEDGIQAYDIKRYNKLEDLKTIGFEDTQKKYNEFATIFKAA